MQKAPKLTSAFIALSGMTTLSGCVTPTSVLPSVKNIHATDAETCLRVNAQSFNPGILIFLPGFSHSDTTKTDKMCETRRVADILIDQKDIYWQTLAIAIYDRLPKEYQQQVGQHLGARGKTIDEVRKNTPTVINSTMNDQGLTVFYRLPGQTDTSPPAMLFRAANDPANANDGAQKTYAQAPRP